MTDSGSAPGIDLDCGIACRRITSWLDDELHLPREGATWVYSEGAYSCRIQTEPLGNQTVGRITLERTRLTARGDAEALAPFRKAFTLRFISAGG